MKISDRVVCSRQTPPGGWGWGARRPKNGSANMKKSVLGLLVCSLVWMAQAAALRPCGLTVEYRENPCGLDTAAPRFAWKQSAAENRSNVRTTAWRILVASSREKLAADTGDVWDSGKVAGDTSVGISYAGRALASSSRYFWKVMTWTDDGASAWSEPAEWTTALLSSADWKAKWIGPAPETRPDEDFGKGEWITAPADKCGVVTLEYAFDFDGVQPGQCVEMVHAGVSQHEIDVNGVSFNKWTGHVHDWRYLRFRDLTPWLVKGRNKIVVRVLADAARRPGEPVDHIRFRAAPDVRAFLAKIIFPDGKTIVTDDSWTSPSGRVQKLGAPRATPYGKELVLRTENASPAFAKTFTVAKPVASAVLHVTGVGFYEASLNGAKIGRKVLDPSPTAFDKRVLYSTYRLDDVLKPGANELKILVGHGWYDMRSILTWNFETSPWRDFPRAIAQLEIVYADGSRETVCSDRTWRQVKSPIGYDDIFDGEVQGAYDRRMPDLDRTPLFAAEVSGPRGRLVAAAHPGAEVMRTISAKTIKSFGNGTYVIDFGENLAGWMRFTLRGQKPGDVVSFRYDERVNYDGSPAISSPRDGRKPIQFSNEKAAAGKGHELRNIDHHFHYTSSQRVCPVDAAFQTDRFVCSGAAEERYEPHFQYSGFRYVVVRGLAREPSLADAEACVIHTAFKTIGRFSCSDETFNTLMEMGEKSYRSNFADGVPTDCPHREKNGWTGDASIASELAQYLFENTATYEKWLRDIGDSQLADGNICCIVPTSGWGYHWGNGPAWDSALPIIAWNLWTYRADRRILDEVYPVLQRYLAYTASRANPQGLVRHGLGDWVPVNRKHMPSTEFTSSCYYYQALRIATEIARLRGAKKDADRYASLAAKTRAGLNAKYYKGKGVYDNGGQTAQGCALAFGIVEPSEQAAVAAELVKSVERAGCHVDMGLLGTKHVFRALARIGRADLAFKMLVNPTKPSPVEWIQKGGTTLWEDWSDGASRTHIMFGDFVGWAYQYLAGIRLEETAQSTSAVPLVTKPGFQELVIEPSLVDSLNWVKAAVESPYGEIESAWVREGKQVVYTITLPPNTKACIKLPGQAPKHVGSGRHVFTCAVR